MTTWVGVITGLDGSREGRDMGSPAAQTGTWLAVEDLRFGEGGRGQRS